MRVVPAATAVVYYGLSFLCSCCWYWYSCYWVVVYVHTAAIIPLLLQLLQALYSLFCFRR